MKARFLALAGVSLVALAVHAADLSPSVTAPAAAPAPKAMAPAAEQGTGTAGAEPAQEHSGDDPASGDAADGDERVPTAVAWDAEARTLSARAQAAPFAEVTTALEAAGVGVKTHPSWAESRISADFEVLPIDDAVRALFGKTFVLSWTQEPESERARPRILLLPRPAELADGEKKPAGAEQPEPPDPEETWRHLAQGGTAAEFEAALDAADARQRAAAMKALAIREQLMTSYDRLLGMVREDESPEVRIAAIGALMNHGFDASSVLALENASGGTGLADPAASPVLTSSLEGGDAGLDELNNTAAHDSDEEVRDAARRALEMLEARTKFFDSLDQDARDWLFKKDEVGSLSEELARRDGTLEGDGD